MLTIPSQVYRMAETNRKMMADMFPSSSTSSKNTWIIAGCIVGVIALVAWGSRRG